MRDMREKIGLNTGLGQYWSLGVFLLYSQRRKYKRLAISLRLIVSVFVFSFGNTMARLLSIPRSE